MTDIIYRSANLEVRRVAAPGQPIRVVTFDCYHDDYGFCRSAFGEDFFRDEGIGAVHLLSAGNDWFQYRDLDSALAMILDAVAGNRHLLAFGSSMGGYGALRLADRIGATTVLSLSPQYSIARRRVPFERRWKQDRERIALLPDLNGPLRVRARAIVAYDTRHNYDRQHVALIAADSEIELLTLPHAGHPVGPFLSDVGLLRPLVLGLVGGTADLAALQADAWRLRKMSPMWLGGLAAAQPAHRPRTAIALAKRAESLAPESPPVLDRLALCLREAGLHREAVTAHRRAVMLAPLPNYLWGLTKSLAAAECYEDALEIAVRLQLLAPDVAGYHRWVATLRVGNGDRAGAIADLQRAIIAAPGHRGYRWTSRWIRFRRSLEWLARTLRRSESA